MLSRTSPCIQLGMLGESCAEVRATETRTAIDTRLTVPRIIDTNVRTFLLLYSLSVNLACFGSEFHQYIRISTPKLTLCETPPILPSQRKLELNAFRFL